MSDFSSFSFQSRESTSLPDADSAVCAKSLEKSVNLKLQLINEPSECRTLLLPDNSFGGRVWLSTLSLFTVSLNLVAIFFFFLFCPFSVLCLLNLVRDNMHAVNYTFFDSLAISLQLVFFTFVVLSLSISLRGTICYFYFSWPPSLMFLFHLI